MTAPGWPSSLVLVALLVSACTSSPDTPAAARATPSVGSGSATATTAPAQTTPPDPGTPTPTPTSAPTTATTPARQVADGYRFRSPSGNILCSLAAGAAVCEILSRSYPDPPRPADCDLDFGDMVELRAGRPATLLCYGDTAAGQDDPTLDYGSAVTAGGVTCTSTQEAVTCRDAGGTHGFALSRQRLRLTPT